MLCEIKSLKNICIIFISLFIFFYFTNPVSATLEMQGADDYQFAFNSDTAYQIGELDTVNPASGTFMIKNTDLSLKGINGLDLTLNRYYNSGVWINRIDGDDINDEIGQLQEFSYLGVGWQPFNLGTLRLTWSEGSNNYFYTEGSYIKFGDGNQHRVYINEAGDGYEIKNHKNWKLEVLPSGSPMPHYKLTKEDGVAYFFDESNCYDFTTGVSYLGVTTGTATSRYCYVTSITGTHGNSIEVYYMPVPVGGSENNMLPQNHGAIDYIVDSVGREIDFDYYIIYNDYYLLGEGLGYYLEHYILNKITYVNANGEFITINYDVSQVYDTIEFPLANTPFWAAHTYKLDKVEVKRGSNLLKPVTYYNYDDHGRLNEVIYQKIEETPDSHLIEDFKVEYVYDDVKHQYSNLWSENLAGYSSRLKEKRVYNGMGDVYEWTYLYGNGLDNYYDSSNGAETMRTFLHCDDNTAATAINCAGNIVRQGPLEGGTVLNFYKQVKIIDPTGSYNVNYYCGSDSDVINLGWNKVRDTAGLLKSNFVYTPRDVLLNKKEYSYNFIEEDIGNQNIPNSDYYRNRLFEKKETKYDIEGDYETYIDSYILYDDYDNLKYHERKGYSYSSVRDYPSRYDSDDKLGKINTITYLHEDNINYKNANILDKIKEDVNSLYFLASGAMSGEIDVSKSIYEYDNNINGDLIWEQQVGLNENDPSPITEYEYDNYGNILIITDPNDNDINIRYEDNVYPSYGWNDVYGDESEPAWEKTYYENGLLESKSDMNDNNVEYYYDSLDRLTKVVALGDTFLEPTFEYVYYDFENKLKVRKKLDDETYNEVYYFYDGLGRLIQTRQEDENIIIFSIKYDGLGRRYYESKPYEENNGFIYNEPDWEYLINTNKVIQYDYDSLGRLVRKANPDYTYMEIEYGPNWKIITDENEVKTLYKYDSFDNLISVEENYIECLDGEIKLCPLRLGVCSNNYQTCSNGVWLELCDYGNSYQISETYYCSDNLDNDCDGLIDEEDPDCQTGNFCFKQIGVCENSMPSVIDNYGNYYCTANDYGLKYERVEVDCTDGLDNDCDGLIDEEDNCNNILTQYHYNILGNLIRVVDAKGNVIQKNYNSLNWLIYNENYDIGLEEYGYDNNGNIITKITNNVLKNSNFEYNNDFWDFGNNVILTGDSYFGDKAIRVNGQYEYAYQEANILNSQDYVLSLYAKSDSKNLGIVIYLYDINDNEIDTTQVSIGNNWNIGCNSHCWYSGSIDVDNEYSRIILPVFTTTGNTYKIKIGIGAAYTGSGYIYLDAIQLEKGIEAKPYSLTLYEYNGINDLIGTSYLGMVEG